MKSLPRETPNESSVPAELTPLEALVLRNKNLSTGLIHILTADVDATIKAESGLTTRNVIGCLPLAYHIKQQGNKLVSQALDIQLTRLAASVNVKHNLTSLQIKQIVNDIIEMYPTESLEDFLLVFKRIRQGAFGDLHHQLDQATIFQCMKQHLEDKSIELERLHKEEDADRVKVQQEKLNYEQMVELYANAMQGNLGKAKPQPRRSQLGYADKGYQEFLKQRSYDQAKNRIEESKRAEFDLACEGTWYDQPGNTVHDLRERQEEAPQPTPEQIPFRSGLQEDKGQDGPLD